MFVYVVDMFLELLLQSGSVLNAEEECSATRLYLYHYRQK